MFQEVERYVNFITKNSLTQSQFLFLYIIRRKKYSLITKYKKAFPTEDGTMIGKTLLDDLANRGFIKVSNEGKVIEDYEVTDSFTNIFLKDAWESSQEVWKAYPGFISISGTNTPLTAMDQLQFAIKYAEVIDYSVEEHLEVLKDVRYGAEKNLIRTTIEKFVNSKGWEKIRERRLVDESEMQKPISNENF